jgi:hypothetical protein
MFNHENWQIGFNSTGKPQFTDLVLYTGDGKIDNLFLQCVTFEVCFRAVLDVQAGENKRII